MLFPQVAPAQSAATAKPNIIFILADDYGIPGVGCYGGAFKTPNLDALAAGGIRFERGYSAPLCAPSRALCMTGRYAFRTGVLDNGSGPRATPQSEISIAKTLKQAGYATAVAGKWRQLAHFTTKEDGQAWGFDEFLIWGTDNAGEVGDRYWGPVYNKNGQRLADTKGKYGPDVMHEFVVDFIARHREQSFFVYYPTPLIHGPIVPTPDSKTKDAAKSKTKDGPLYTDNIAYLDKLVGKLVAELDRLGLREKTLIVFAGDNGSVPEGTIHGRLVNGHKGMLLEGGSRVPLIANWKGTAPAGTVLKDLVDFTDFYATFAELAGAKLPEGVKLDSHSFAPQLRGEKGNPREWLYIQLGNQWYARNDGWKLNQNGEFFDMRDAPFVEKLVSAETQNEAAKSARQKLRAVLDELNPASGHTKAARDNAEKKAKKKLKKQQKKAGAIP